MFFPGADARGSSMAKAGRSRCCRYRRITAHIWMRPLRLSFDTDDAQPLPRRSTKHRSTCFFNGRETGFFRIYSHGHVISAAEVDAELERIGHELQPLDIVLVKSGAVYGTGYLHRPGCGMGVCGGNALSHRTRRAGGRNRRVELGLRRSATLPNAGPRHATRRSFGKATRRVVSAPTTRLKN